MPKLILAIAAAVLAAPSAAQVPAAPKLAVEISIDGLSPDLLQSYRPFLSGGLARLTAVPGRANSNAARQVVVAGSAASAVALGGPSADQRWYWSGEKFVTDLDGPAPASIGAANAAIAREIATVQPPLDPPPDCLARAVGASGTAFARAAGDATAFHQSPEADGAVLAVSAALVRELGLGRSATPATLFVGLPAARDIARKYGAEGQEMCLEIHSLDRDLGDFLARLDAWGLQYSATLVAH